MQPRTARWYAGLAVSVVVLFSLACGGSSSSDATATPDTGDTGVSPTATTRPSTSSNIDPDTAVVNIGDKQYEFSMAGPYGDQCLTLFGVVGGAGKATDGSDVSVDMGIPPEGYESDPRYVGVDPPSIRVTDDENNQDWRAGGDFNLTNPPKDGESQVDSYTNDGKTASGTATFIEMNAFFMSSTGQAEYPTPVQGTFEISCN